MAKKNKILPILLIGGAAFFLFKNRQGQTQRKAVPGKPKKGDAAAAPKRGQLFDATATDRESTTGGGGGGGASTYVAPSYNNTQTTSSGGATVPKTPVYVPKVFKPSIKISNTVPKIQNLSGCSIYY